MIPLKYVLASVVVASAVSVAAVWQPDRASREQDWPFYGGDQGGMKYSPLTDVNSSTVSRLGVAWEWSPREKALSQFGTRPGNFQATPLMIDNVLYLSTPYNRVVALERRHRRGAVGLRSEGVRGRPAAERDRLRPSRRGGVARRRRRQQAAHLHQQPLPPDLPRRGDRTPGRKLRHARHVRSEQGAGLGDQQDPLHQHVAADRLQGSGDSRQRRRRSAGVSQRSARRRPRLRCAHREAGLVVPADSAARRVRQRHLGR